MFHGGNSERKEKKGLVNESPPLSVAINGELESNGMKRGEGLSMIDPILEKTLFTNPSRRSTELSVSSYFLFRTCAQANAAPPTRCFSTGASQLIRKRNRNPQIFFPRSELLLTRNLIFAGCKNRYRAPLLNRARHVTCSNLTLAIPD